MIDVMNEVSAMPEFECFDVGIVRSVGLFVENRMAAHPDYNYVMGVASGMPTDPDLLNLLRRYSRPECTWQVQEDDRRHERSQRDAGVRMLRRRHRSQRGALRRKPHGRAPRLQLRHGCRIGHADRSRPLELAPTLQQAGMHVASSRG